MSTDVATRQESLPAAPTGTAVTPMEMLSRALERGIDSDQLDKLMTLQQRWDADQARKEFVKAMAAFKAEPLRLTRDRTVSYSGTNYSHASLAQVVDAVVAALSKHGLSHRWETTQEGDNITVSCVLTHELGHSERTTLSAGPDKSGSKNSIQAIGSTVTYLQRYTLMAATGLAAHDMDDDGRNAAPTAETISQEQLADLEAKIEEVGANRENFLKVCKLEDFAQMPKSKYDAAIAKLDSKANQQ